MAKKKYTYTCMVEYPDGRVENLKELPPEEQDRLATLWGERMAAIPTPKNSTQLGNTLSRAEC